MDLRWIWHGVTKPEGGCLSSEQVWMHLYTDGKCWTRDLFLKCWHGPLHVSITRIPKDEKYTQCKWKRWKLKTFLYSINTLDMASVVQLQTHFNINNSISIYYKSLIFWNNPQLDSGDLGTQGILLSHVGCFNRTSHENATRPRVVCQSLQLYMGCGPIKRWSFFTACRRPRYPWNLFGSSR